VKTYERRPRHHISEKQDRWYWREWGKVNKALLRLLVASREAEEGRHGVQAGELGGDRSHKGVNDGEFECVIAGFLAVSEPDNLDAQVKLRGGSVRRLMEGIRRLATGHEGYIESILEDIGETREWERLDARELVKLRSTLARRIERKKNFEQEGAEIAEAEKPF